MVRKIKALEVLIMGNITINLTTVLWVAGAIATLAATGSLLHKLFKRIAKYLTKDSVDEAVNTETQEIKEVIDGISVTLNEVQVSLNDFIEKSENDFSDVKKILRDQIRERIIHIHNECIKNDRITEQQLFTVEELYSDYHDKLGGNSFVDTLMEDLRELYHNQ